MIVCGPAWYAPVAGGFDLGNYIAAGATGYTFTDNYNASYISAVGGGSSDNIRSFQGRNDKRYWEVTVNTGFIPNGGVMRIGVFQSSGNISPPIGNSTPSTGYASHVSGASPTAFVNSNGATIITTGAAVYAAGNTVLIAVDGTTGNVWFGLDGTWMTGNPSTGSAPTTTISTGTYFVAVCADEPGNGGGNFSVTGRFRVGTTIYPTPTGFSCWDD